LQTWENAPSFEGVYHVTGYLTSLISIIGDTSSTNTTNINIRLMAAILLKNGIPKSFSVPLPESPNSEMDMNTLTQLQQERANIRNQLPVLLFREVNATIALHLQLSLSDVALFDFPKVWPSLLEDLFGVASGQSELSLSSNRQYGCQTMRIRAIKTLRLCLQTIRQRKVIVPKQRGGGAGNNNPMMNMRNLGSMIGKAAEQRKQVHSRACSIFGPLAEGMVQHAQSAVGGGGTMNDGDVRSAWLAEAFLAVGYIKCLTELLPMMEIENIYADPRTPSVRSMMESLVQICDAVKAYPSVSVPPTLANIPSIHEEYSLRMDKIYRATLRCCMCSIQSQPQLFAPNISRVLPSVVEPMLTLDANVLHSMPEKRLMNMTGLITTVLSIAMYDEKRKDSLLAGNKNAVLGMLLGKKRGSNNDGPANNPNDDRGVMEARNTVTALLTEGTIERIIETLVGKFLRLYSEEIEEWNDDPEGRYETDLAEKSSMEKSPRHCAGALLLQLMDRETDRVAQTLLELTQRVYQQLPPDDVNGMLSREACYRALELCHSAMVGRGQNRLNFSEWFHSELLPILQADLGEDSPAQMRAMQARAVQVVQAYSTSLKTADFSFAFQTIARLMAAPDLVTAFCAARCINHLALLHVKGTEESAQLESVREHSVFALGNTFALANRAESEECLSVTLMCVSALVEANGLYLEPVIQAIAEQLLSLWERARDSVPIHSCLLSVLNHLIMKMGYATIENQHVQTVLFPLLDYCTDISVTNRAETLLEDGLRLWLVTVVSSRVATMGPKLTNMLPRLEAIIRSGLEPDLSLKVLQFNALLLGPQVIEPLAPTLRDMLVSLTRCIHSEQKAGDDTSMDGDNIISGGTDRGVTTMRNATAALSFGHGLMQMFPDLGLSISSPAIAKVVAVIPGKAIASPLVAPVFNCFGRMLWISPNALDEIFANDPNIDEKIASVVSTWISVVTSVPANIMTSSQAQKISFINQKKACLSLCSAVCRSPRLARVAGKEIQNFSGQMIAFELTLKLDLDALVEAASGTTRKVVGDGPLGDLATQNAEMLKSDPLLTISLREASLRMNAATQFDM